MNRDRMPDLFRLHEQDPLQFHEPEHHANIPMDPELQMLLQRTEKVLKFLHQIVDMLEQLRRHHSEVLTSTSVMDANEQRRKVTLTMNRFTAVARKTKVILRRMELSEQDSLQFWSLNQSLTYDNNAQDITVRWEQSSSAVQVSWSPTQSTTPRFIPAELRMQMILHSVLSFRLRELVRDYYTEQKNYNEMSQRKIERQISIIGKQLDPDEIARLTDENIPLLHADIKDDEQISKEMRDRIRDVVHFEREILQLERDITKLHQAFLLISQLAHEQGVLVDQIEHHVIMAGDYVESSNLQLRKADKLSDKYRKKKCLLVICLLIALGIIAAIIAVAVNNSQSHSSSSKKSVHPTAQSRTRT